MSVNELMRQGERAMREDRPEAALAILRRALQYDPKNIDAAYYIAQCLANMDRLDDAITQFDKLLQEVNPDSDQGADILVSKGDVLLEMNDLHGADLCFDHALQVKPRVARIWVQKAQVAARKKRFDKALEYCDRALTLDPEDNRAWNSKASALLKLGHLDDCIICARKALSLRPDYAMPWAWLAEAYKKKGDVRKAKKCLEKYKYYLATVGRFPAEPTIGHERKDIAPRKKSRKTVRWCRFWKRRKSKVQELLASSARGDAAAIRALLAEGIDLNLTDSEEWTALGVAALEGQTEVVASLIGGGADVDAKIQENWTPLFFAASKGHISIVEALLDKGADVNGEGSAGTTPLICATREGQTHVVQALIKARADMEMVS